MHFTLVNQPIINHKQLTISSLHLQWNLRKRTLWERSFCLLFGG